MKITPPRFFAFLLLFILSFSLPAAQNYDLYLNPAPGTPGGCSAPLVDATHHTSLSGFQYKLSVSADDSGQVTLATLACCAGGQFGAGSADGITAAHLNTTSTVPPIDRLELSLPLSRLGNPKGSVSTPPGASPAA